LERTEEKDLTGVPTSDDVVSPRDFRVRAVAQALAGDGALLAELCGHPSTALPADNILAGLQASAARQGREFGAFEGMFSSSAALAARYGSDHCWSPSQLERYARCPYQFLLASVMRLEPLDEPALEVDYLGRGRMLHEVLLAAHRGLNERAQAHRSPSEEPEDQFHAASLELLRKRVGQMLGERALDNGLLEIDARHVAAWLSGYHRQHSAYDQLWREPVRPAHFEVAFGPRRRGDEEEPGELPADLGDELSTSEPFELECGEETIRFSGRIDRIDIGQLGGQAVFNIVDYKSGSPSPATSARAVVEGYSLQLPLYALAARWLLAGKRAIPFRAAYWHVAADGYKEKEAIKFQLDADGRLAASPDWEGLEIRLRERVRSLVDGIRGGQFPMHSVDDKCTSRCPYSTVCRVNQVRQLGKAWQAPREESK
jgi:RecB family exonuclease